MKKISLFLLFINLVACSSSPTKLPEEKGTMCLTQVGAEVRCFPIRDYQDPTRFHKLNDSQKRSLPDMPELD